MESFMKEFEHLKIQLAEIKTATDNFNDHNLIGSGGFGKVYSGELSHHKGRGVVAIKRLDRSLGQGNSEFWKEVTVLSRYPHQNLISLLGFCVEGVEMILVYEHAVHGGLDGHIDSADLSWMQRINICLDAARGLKYLHDDKGNQQRVLHRDIKSSNILLDAAFNAKVSDMGLSKMGPANQPNTAVMTNAVGTLGYWDPIYIETGLLSKESDVYSFGVVLSEVLFGKLCWGDINGQFQVLVPTWKKDFEKKNLDQLIFQCPNQQMDSSVLRSYSDLADACLKTSREERPSMAMVVETLENALAAQEIYERVKLPTDYKEMIKRAVPPLNNGSEEEIKKLLLKGTLLDSGKTWFQLNKNGKHYEMISMAACLPESEQANFSKSESRFTVGSYAPPNKKTPFMTRIKPQVLSPNITYIMSLVFKKKTPNDLYIGLEYKFKGTTYYSFLSNKREDGWSTAELFQFATKEIAAADELEIMFNIKYCDLLEVEGIEFQPLEEVEQRVLVGSQVNTQASGTIWKENLQTVNKHGKKCTMLLTRMTLKDDGCSWNNLPQTSFEEETQNHGPSKFRISCNIELKKQSSDTTYAVYLIYKQNVSDSQPAPALVEDKTSRSNEALRIYLKTPQTPVIVSGDVCKFANTHRPNLKCIPRPRSDGWMEVQIWEFKTNRNTTIIPMDLELSSYDKRSFKRLKAGGIEFRPIDKIILK